MSTTLTQVNQTTVTPTPIPTLPPITFSNVTFSNATTLPQDESIQLAQQSKKLPDRSNLYETTLSINASNNNALAEIDKVSYYLHPTFEPNVINSSSSTDKFGITITNWGVFNLKAKAFFKDGRVQDLSATYE